MNLRSKLFIFMSGLFLLFSSSVWVYSSFLLERGTVFNTIMMIPILSILFLFSLLAVGLALNRLILAPLDNLKKQIQKVKEGNYELELPHVGTHEIASLCEQFQEMLLYVRTNNEALESNIKERTLSLINSEQKLNTILDTVEAFIFIKDTHYRYLYANKKTCELFGQSLEEIIGQDDTDFFDTQTVQKIRTMDEKVFVMGEKVTGEEVNTNVQGTLTTAYISTKLPLFDKDGNVYALCGISTDITERKRTEEIIKALAYHDALTGLPNRRMLDERLNLVLSHNARVGEYAALMVLDLDNFKPLNDSAGHSAGDILLAQVATRLLESVRQEDTVARFGGDEFVVVLGYLGTEFDVACMQARHVAEKMLLHVSKPFSISLEREGQEPLHVEHHCTASIGVTLFKGTTSNIDKLFQEADKAMYDAKEKGRARIEFFKERV